MSNNKQSSIEWLMPNILGLTLELSNNRISQRTSELKILELFKQAKEMHKKEIENALLEHPNIDAEQYYNETFGE